MIVRRYHAIFFGVALLLPGAVSYSSWEPNPSPLTRPEIGILILVSVSIRRMAE